MVAKGFDLSIDDCINKDIDIDDRDDTTSSSNSRKKPLFVDYGQCDRFHETFASPWWKRHRQSFAARQLFSHEQGMGWHLGGADPDAPERVVRRDSDSVPDLEL